MGQQQPQRPPDQSVKYADMFAVQGDLAHNQATPRDAGMMQTAEADMLGGTQKGGLAAAMQSAAARNERAGFVGHEDVSGPVRHQGVGNTEANLLGQRIITESVAGQVIEEYSQSTPAQSEAIVSPDIDDPISIGEALEAAALTVGDVPVDLRDTAAIQAAEVRASGCTSITAGGVAAAAQSAATLNARIPDEAAKTTLRDILTDATSKLPSDKQATRRDAEGVTVAELRNDPDLTTRPGGVAASLAAAARLNHS